MKHSSGIPDRICVVALRPKRFNAWGRATRAHTGAWFLGALLLLGLSAAVTDSLAKSELLALASPTGPVVLTVRGKITRTNAPGAARFDRAMLIALSVITIKTGSPWTDGPADYAGTPVRKLLSAVGATGTRVRARALDDYQATIPMSDFDNYDVILAYRMDGSKLGIRNRGPLRVIYPWDRHQELRKEVYYLRAVWQLTELTVE